jgi:hypothetical protein
MDAGFRFRMVARKHVRIKNGYRIDVRTSALDYMCYFDTHQSIYIVENNCKDDIMVFLHYFDAHVDRWSARMPMYTKTYHSPLYTVKAGGTRQFCGPARCLCEIDVKTVVDTKYKTVWSMKSKSHKAFSTAKDGNMMYYGVAKSAHIHHKNCEKEEEITFLPINHPLLVDLVDRIRR